MTKHSRRLRWVAAAAAAATVCGSGAAAHAVDTAQSAQQAQPQMSAQAVAQLGPGLPIPADLPQLFPEAANVLGTLAVSTIVYQGAEIAAPSGQCSLTIASPHTAYTSLHCGYGVWQVGSQVKDATGAVIGTITGIGNQDGPTPVDAVRIALGDNVVVTDVPAGIRNPEELAVGTPIAIRAVHTNRNGTYEGNNAFVANVSNWGVRSQVIQVGLETVAGDSGGAIFDDSGHVIGILCGIGASGKSVIVPMSYIQQQIPAV